MSKGWKLGLFVGVAVTALALGGPAQAVPTDCSAGTCVLTDGNSVVRIDPDAGTFGNYTFDWTVDGVDQLFDQSFWYRIGITGGEAAVSTLTLDEATTVDTGGDAGDDAFRSQYSFDDSAGTAFTIEIDYDLIGGSAGSGTADLREGIRITNTGTETLDFHFFQYNDFDLDGSPSDASVEITGGNTADQVGNVSTFGEVIAGNAPEHFQVDTFGDLIALLTDVLPLTMDDGAGGNPLVGLDDYEFGFQWDFVLAPGGTFLISKDKLISPIPEPGTLGLFGMGLLGLGLLLRRRKTPA